MKKHLLFFLLITVLLNAQAQNVADDLWTKSANLKSASTEVLKRESVPSRFELYKLNLSLLKERLKDAPQREANYGRSNVIISFPNNKGILEDFQIMETSVMEAALQEKYPEIRSYIGKGIDNPGSTIRFSVTQSGLNGLLLSSTESDVLIDPYTRDRLSYMVYAQKDLPVIKASLDNDVINSGLDKKSNILKSSQTNGDIPNDGKQRTFRLALACTGEYSQYILTKQGVSESASDEVKKATVLADLNTIMTRVNAIYERDICLTMKLVANSTSIIFLDPNTDGYRYNPSDGANLFTDNQRNCDQMIGPSNYDIGHLLLYSPLNSGAGLAGLGVVCSAWSKSCGLTYYKDDAIYYTLSHEIGHQFGASHTFNLSSSGLTTESVELGSGASLMGYGEQSNKVNYFFNSVSILVIWHNITSGFSQCALLSETGNTAPIADAGNGVTIPKSTPFLLEGKGTDINGNGTLTYSWEQIDAERTSYPPVSIATAGPVFQWKPPTSSSMRYMPDLSTIISGSLTSDTEAVPSVARVLNFNFVVRDNDPRGGQLAIDKKVITVDGNSGPFLITSHKTSETWYSGSTQTITWDVAGTNNGTVNVQTVDLLFSTDGGYTYPTILASSVPNDGSQDIVIPFGIKTTTGRYKVRAVGNIFFAINSADLTIDEAPFLTNFSNKSIDLCLPESSVTFEFTYNSYLGYSGTTTFSAINTAGTSVTFIPTSSNTDGTLVRMTVTGITPANQGINTITCTGTSSGNPVIVSLEDVLLNVFNTTIPPVTLLSPANGSVNVAPPYVLSWNAETNAKTYTVELATDEAFANVIETATLSANSYNPSTLTINTDYYWRVKSDNPCANGIYSSINSFKTLDLSMFTFIPDDNFYQALKERGYNTDNVDNYVRTSNVKNVDRLEIGNSNINDLTGIQDFTSLSILECSGNHLKNLNLSKNTVLWFLDCSQNELTYLDVTNCINLALIHCYQNELISLDVTSNSSLNQLNCGGNKLTQLDVTKNSALTSFWCNQNQLTSLDVSKNPQLQDLEFDNNNISNIDLAHNLEIAILFCNANHLTSLDISKNIEIYSLQFANNNISAIDLSKSNKLWVLVCNANKLTSLELSSNPELFQLICGDNDLEILSLTNNNKLYFLSIDNNKLSNIDLSGNINLSYLSCNQNQIAELDLTKNIYLSELYIRQNNLVNINLSKNPQIKYLTCSLNKIKNLDLTQNTVLQDLQCQNNQITSLDLSNNSQIFRVFCSDNQLEQLNLKNGNNDNLKYFFASFNPNLACIQVDNVALSLGYQSWYKDPTASYSEDCSTFVPVPTITSFNPASSCPGQTITISGSHFTGATEVRFGGTPSTSFTIESASLISAVVGEGESGDVSITTAGGTAARSGYEFRPLPAAAGVINGLVEVHQLEYSVPYSVSAINDATTYMWAYSGTGATINNGSNASITIDFAADATSGDLTVMGTNPCGNGPSATLSITIPSIRISKTFSAGWTWFSVNVTDTDMSTAKVLSNLKSVEGDYIKNQIASATYYNGTGWFGELTQIDPKEMYKIKLSAADTLKFVGFPVDPLTSPITIKAGWNWIGYIPQTSKTITEALSTIDPVTDDYIKNQTVSSTFYDGTGWFGYLDNLEPFDGYMLRTSHTGTLTFTAGGPLTSGMSEKFFCADIVEDVYSSIGSVNVMINTISTSPISIKIIDMQGRVVLTKFFDQIKSGKQNLKVETGSMPGGSYSLLVNQDNKISTKQIIVR